MTRQLTLRGDRQAIRQATCEAALAELDRTVSGRVAEPAGGDVDVLTREEGALG